MDSEFKLLISVKNQSVSPGGRTPLIIQWDHSGRQEALQEGAVINPSCGGVFQRTPPPASLLQLLPSVWREGLGQLGCAASSCRPQEPALHLAGAPWRNLFCSGNLAGFPCFFWNPPLPLWGTLHED